jgi:alkylhydroperoxidase/carboxymuconolactone decarboxylase family protein YurZ
VKLREIAYSRSGDKGDVSNICVFPYDDRNWDLLREQVTAEAVRDRFGALVTGEVIRYELPKLPGLNFVLTGALGGGVSMSLRTDPHGKSYQSLILDLDLDGPAADGAGTGRARRERAQGAMAGQLQEALAALDPQLAQWADSFVFGEVWGRAGLSQDERMLVAITALAATGHPVQLKNYLHGALDAGIAASKIHEALVMLTVYCGFPAALSSLSCWKQVAASARRRGVPIDVEHL